MALGGQVRRAASSLYRPDSAHRPSSPGKGTLARLNATPEERTAREQKLADAVKVLLECIGEDPERDGLLKTPERYAKALLWMTKGYEERLPGAHISWAHSLIPC
jgi:GTP cyclohydrolase I